MTTKRLTLAQAFGTNASQSPNELTIAKPDLAKVGLTPSAINTAESLLAAFLLQLLRNYEGFIETNRGILTCNGIPLTYNQQNLYSRIGAESWRSPRAPNIYSFIFHLYLPPDTAYQAPINPMDFNNGI